MWVHAREDGGRLRNKSAQVVEIGRREASEKQGASNGLSY